jgi:uncharacterized membrane protein
MFTQYIKFSVIILFITIFLSPFGVNAQELIQDKVVIVKAKVLEVVSQEQKIFPSTEAKHNIQTIKVKILEGENINKIVSFENDYVILDVGDEFYLRHTSHYQGKDFYSVSDPNRVPVLMILVIIFIVLVIFFGGMQGFRGLLSLAGSLVIILFVLLPGIIHGFSPFVLSVAVSSFIIILGSYITHGFNRATTSAVFGMVLTVIITGIMAYFAVHNSYLTGVTDDESIFLNFNLKGGVDLVGLLMGGIMIGLLGVLYDASIGQSISVEELHKIAPHVNRWEIYKRAIRIGREHIGALVDTLAIAYVGASLPLLLLFYSASDNSFLMIINNEVFATEIIRILVGSIGLVLAVPITTLFAVYMLIKNDKNNQVFSEEILKKEKFNLEHFKHQH